MRGKTKTRQYLSLLLSGGIIFGYSFPLAVSSLNIQDTERIKVDLQKRKKELSKELKSVANEVHKEADNKASLENQIKLLQEQIDVSNSYIITLEKEISEMEEQIAQTRQNMKEKIEALRKSLASIYVAGDTSTVDIILGSRDFNDFLDKVDIVRSVSQTVKKLVDGLQADIESIQNKEKGVLANKEEAEKEKEILNKNREDLGVLFEKSEKLLSELQDTEAQVKKQIDQSNSEIKAIDEKIRKYYEELRRKEEEEERRRKAAEREAKKSGQAAPNTSAVVTQKVTPHKGCFVWPVPTHHKITSGFYDTESRSHVHGAIDIAGRGAYGANIVASGSGKVILANRDGYGGGYGNYVVIDHGNGVSTLYGHMSNVSVKAGQLVTVGQKIGNVGNTGFSTGPHLHFEYRVNGVRRNPIEILAF